MTLTTPQVSVLMYHFVRDLTNTRYPDIKGLDYKLFIEQIEYLKKHYNFITMEALIDSIDNKTELPPKAVLLTFDDAYSDHFKYVFPILDKHKIQGAFYAPVQSLTQKKVLDVNKIHYILAAEPDKAKIISLLYDELAKYRKDHNLKSDHDYYTRLATPGRYDIPEVMFIKRMLQFELETDLRKKIVNTLFQTIVQVDEKTFHDELYLSMEQLQCMHRNGMHIGNHGYKHYWLNSLSKEEQRKEISKGCDFLKEVGVDMNNWTITYPYGAQNDDTIEIVKEFNCKLGFTIDVDIANISKHDRYKLPRLNTNDIPKDRNAKVNEWYDKHISAAIKA